MPGHHKNLYSATKGQNYVKLKILLLLFKKNMETKVFIQFENIINVLVSGLLKFKKYKKPRKIRKLLGVSNPNSNVFLCGSFVFLCVFFTCFQQDIQ